MIIDTCRVCPVHIQCILECSSISRTRLTQFDGLNWLEWWKSNIAYNRIKSNKIDYLNFLWIIWQYRLGQTNLNTTTPQHTEPVFGLVCPNLYIDCINCPLYGLVLCKVYTLYAKYCKNVKSAAWFSTPWLEIDPSVFDLNCKQIVHCWEPPLVLYD